jgi:hypothetical protein
VRVWKTADGTGQRLHSPGVLPLKAGELLRIEAEVDRPAYLYLVYLDCQGKATPLYPWQGGWQKRGPEAPRERLSVPESGAAPLDPGPSGVESILLLARAEPLPPEQDAMVERAFRDLPGQQGLLALPAAAWFRDGRPVSDEPDRASIRLGDAKAVNDPLGWARGTQEGLADRLRPYFPASRAVCFSFRGPAAGAAGKD